MKGKMLAAMLVLLVISFFLYQYRDDKRKKDRQKIKDSIEVVSGFITDQDTNQPISKVTVYLLGTNVQAVSNSRGAYTIEARMGDELIVSHHRYKKKSVEVNSNDLNIQLSPLGTENDLSEKIKEDFPEMEIIE